MKVKKCTRCIMDTEGDPYITFNHKGECNYCTYALGRMNGVYFPNEEGMKKLDSMLNTLKEQGRGKDYDCIMGLSGGLDSAYLAYLGAKKWNLRILGVHIDDGFDSPVAIKNVTNLCENCHIPLVNIKLNEEEFADVTRSFFYAGVPGLCIPQDNALVAKLFAIADKYKIQNFLSGTNFALESVLQRGDMHNYADKVHIKAIHKKFGQQPIKNLLFLSLFDRYIKYKYFKKQYYLRPLDLIDYNKERAIEELKTVDFNYYEGKHYENILTKFLQVYYMPKKFNIDIRKSHLSSLIVSGQLTREEALQEYNQPLYKEEVMENEINMILSKLKISRADFNRIMNEPPKKHTDYKASFLNKFSELAIKYRKYLSD